MMEVVRTDVMRGAFGRVAFGDRKGRFYKISPYNLTQGAIFGVKNGEVTLRYTKYGRVSSGSKFGKVGVLDHFSEISSFPSYFPNPRWVLPTLRTPKAKRHSSKSRFLLVFAGSPILQCGTPVTSCFTNAENYRYTIYIYSVHIYIYM